MAEVKRATPGLSSLSSNKPPSYNNNGVKPSSSSSSKHIYDDVFASPPQRNLKPSRLCSFLDDDYGEIFGSSKSDDGSWLSACSSVPILELSPESQQARGGGGGGGGGEREIDYSRVFGGFGDDSFGVPDGKELFDQLKKKKAKTSSSASMQRSEGQTPEVPISHICRQSDSGRAQSSGFCQSFDVEHFKHKSDGITAEGTTSAAHVLDTPGSTCQLDEGVSSQKTQTGKSPVVKDDTELGTDVSPKKKQKEKYSRNGTFDLAADEQNSVHDACSQKASGFSAPVSVAEFRDSCHESAKNVRSKIVEDDDKVGFDVKGDASLAGVSDLGANRKNSEHDTSSHRASVATSHETSQVAGCSNVADVEANLAKIAAGSNVGKKKWRHTRMTSLDFGDHKEDRKNDTRFNRKSRLGTSYSFDASHDPFSARIRVQSSKAVPSSSVPQFFPVESHCKILENSSCESSANNPYSCEEQLDVSSAAAVSVAALQRALQEAEMKIRSAKQFLEREGQCSTKWSFKDTLKGKVAKENKHSNDLDEFRPLSFKGAPKEKVVKDKKRGNDVKEFQLQKIREDRVEVHNTTQSSHSERQNVDGSAQFTPVFDGHKNSSEDEDPKDGEDSRVSKLIEEGDKHEEGGGEWEAAKPLNQLISGVKNRIASFMTWRADTEKKVESEEIEATKRSVEPSEEIQPDSKDLGISEMKEAENNRCSSTSASNSDHEENEIGLIQAASEPKEEESTRCTTLKEDEAGGNVDLIPDFKGSTGESFLHFTFMGESSHNLSAHEGEKIEAQVNRELEFEKRQEPLLNEAKDEQIHEKYEEANREELDGSFMSQHCGNCDEESDGMVEVDYSKAEDEIKEFIQEESYRRLNEQCGEEPTDNSDLPIELEEYEVEKEAEHLQGEVPVGNSYCPENVTKIIENDNVWEEQFLKEAEVQQDDIQLVEETNQVGEIGEGAEVPNEIYEWQENERVQSDQGMSNPVDNVTGELPKWGENKSQSQTNHTAELVEHFSFIAADAECRQTEKVFLRTDEEACQIDWGNPGVEEAVYPDEESDRILEIRSSSSEPKTDIESPILPDQESEKMMEMPNPSSEPKMDFKNPILTQKGSELIGQERVFTPVSTENNEQCEGIEYQHGTNRSFPYETPVLQTSETDANCVQKDIGEELMESKPEEILKHHTDHFNAYGKTLIVEEVASVSDEEGEKCRVEAGHRRRRWFENGDEVGATDRPSILEGCAINLETDQEVLEECDLVGSVEIDSTKVNDETTEISNAREANTPLNKEDHEVKVLAPQKRRRWFVNKGEGVPEPPNLFESTTVTLDMDPEIVNESLPNDMSDNCVDKLPTESGDSQTVPEVDVVTNELKDKHTNEAAPRRKRWFENGEKVIPAEQLSIDEEAVTYVEINQESNTTGDEQKCGNLGSTPIPEVKEGTEKVEPVNELHTDSDAVNRKEKERAKERIAVERVIREARERAFAEARERARRDAVERPNAEPRQRAGGMGQDRTGSGKAFAEASSSSDRASMEAKLRVERAAVERATAEARERAMQKALSEKASHKSQEQAGRPVEKNSSMDPRFHSSGSYSRSSHSSNKAEKFDGAEAESPQRHKARLERQNRTMERAAKALEEKNKRDVLAQKEQAARNMLADSLGAEVKRWSCGKEGNLRALLSTLQYILGPESGWQAVSLTDLVAPTAVRKAYKKANLCVHPDKLQQRGASVQQKYICEKVFDLLKEAWSKFNPDER